MPQLHETECERRLFGAHIPKLVKALETIADELAQLNKNLNKEAIQKAITRNELADYLNNGWRFVGSCGEESHLQIVVEIDADKRR